MKCVVLSSGGMDSTTCAYIARERYGCENVVLLNAFYGQRFPQEIECQKKISELSGLRRYEMDLTSVFQYAKNCALLGGEVIKDSYENQYKEGEYLTSDVPFRNGLLLSAAASFARGIFKDEEVVIMLGTHETDSSYPDCSKEFLDKMNDAFLQGTYGKIHLERPLTSMTKTDVVKEGLRLGVPYKHTYSCYEGSDIHCGECAACIERKAAFHNNGVVDPTQYIV